ncbi:MAG TPA: translation elongation factor Ts [Mycobacteriales bacterium]|jgi:elongation factor Ts|nr:translation elongation factor Ts [Mycobacteriales bacterium]
MAVSAADVKRLRDLTGAGMMDSKNALQETDGDFDKAVEFLRVKQGAKVAKRGSERTATNGLVAAADGAMIALNSETDFVAKNEEFQSLAADIVAVAAASKPADVDALAAQSLADGRTVATAIEQTAAAIGEKLELGRVAVFDGKTTTYLHRRATDLPPQIGVLVEFEGDDAETARGVAMQIATYDPPYLSREDVPADVVDNERRIAEATAREEGKPEQALPKIIEGRLNGFFKDAVLLDQPYVRDNKKTVGAVLSEAGVTVTRFIRFAVGA